MSKKTYPVVTVKLEKIVGGGQALGTLDDGRKIFVWGGLPGETVEVQITKKKSKMAEGTVVKVIKPSADRLEPRDVESYLSTSPWQIMNFEAEQHYKAALIEEAFELHDIVLPNPIEVYSDGRIYEYRNKVEFSWWFDKDKETLDLAFYRRGSHNKQPVGGTSLADPKINDVAIRMRNILRESAVRRTGVRADILKTLLVRCDKNGDTVLQLYVKTLDFPVLSDVELKRLDSNGFELIYSNPKSPASVITEKLQSSGVTTLTDSILGIPFTYAAEGFFQINIPVYEQALRDMKQWVNDKQPVLDLYSGVGTIGLTIGGQDITMVEINESAVSEMKRNIKSLHREKSAKAILAPSENAVEYINGDSMIIVDPPRAGLHEAVISKILSEKPSRIVYLSCNPVTQARDVARLADKYGIRWHQGYNFFPRTPHIEHLVILDLK